MNWRVSAAATALCILGPLASPTLAQTPPDQQALDRYQQSLDSLVPALLAELATPGAAVALIRNGEVALARGYGWADREQRQRVTTSTLFNVGSISKTVAAWGLLKLVENGQLDLEVPVETYLTRWHLPPSEFDHDAVTLERLLSHTAGLRLHGYPGFEPEQPLPSVEQSLSGETNGSGDVRVIMEPATKWQYSGGGFTLAQLLVEEVTGRPFADYMRDEILVPLGMTSSSYVWNEMVDERAATPYGPLGPIGGPRFTAQAAAGLQTSLDDFTRFALASMSGEFAALATGVLATETVESMQQPLPASPNYGLGYSISEVLGGARAAGHGGSNSGWQARFLVLPRFGDGLIVMTNSTLGSDVHRYLFCEWGYAARSESGRCRKGIGSVMVSAIERFGVADAIRHYRELNERDPEGYDFLEIHLNRVGYALLGADRVEDAIEIFKLNVEEYPEASNPYDSLGEAYLVHGDTALAVANYRKSLELDPDNQNAVEMLQKLEGGSGGDRAPRADADAKLRDLEPLGLVSWGVRNEGSNMALFAALGSGARATLESAGIRLVDEFQSPPTPYLYLAVFLRDTLEVTAYRAHLRLVEIVPHRSGAYVDALLWETPDVLGVAHRDSADSAALAAADKLLQRFLGDYLRVNPR